MGKNITVFLIIMCLSLVVRGQNVIPLYQDEIPGSIPDTNYIEKERIDKGVGKLVSQVSVPTLTLHLPQNPNGMAVIICPGGGYSVLLMEREGNEVAKAFNKLGITAFVLKYRLPNDRIMKEKSMAPLQDVMQAMKIVRQNAKGWKINKNKIGVMGFSAGGHLAATLATHYNDTLIENKKRIKLRPDFMLLIYPVISFQDGIVHKGSRKNLLGEEPTKKQIEYFSNEKYVNKHTPSAFITYAKDDSVVLPENSIHFIEALKVNGIYTGEEVYDKGGHGYLKEPSFDDWFIACANWLKNRF